ncbi:MAG: hypothetical protein BWY43_00038 [candidate division WS2 bacterium ADurb.Bin280]|uniref:Uncharacterized protein n=1 Tax=candidate division WS2 bacterium ADurb.Bin280 TaxID=1852829 RepID=A0A1V5SFV2_9BACT|nr:MAG: hypothetical protein BWY43_00038 [candidate division WS2 bacterium ADurb.Bin280]
MFCPTADKPSFVYVVIYLSVKIRKLPNGINLCNLEDGAPFQVCNPLIALQFKTHLTCTR